ncbi:MAG: murein L,D-transpeptidase [Bradyrhizobium sp.]|uniref:L,D-transpeptidase family protein n=1 Tax=Bradyrhizobium sp. TaxID=376 RepID=UPI00121E916A|nr:murein L,D-transpeptidase family protein [Bradyrhizobium sp.]THD45113.1 MAG: murein L,D-transpeptidase [Bradyrhizobium sp.]
MIGRSLVRALITSAALAAGGLLAGCNSDEISLASNAKANQPVSPKLVAEMVAKDMDLQSPILVRLFKQEAELEVWKQDRSGRFALLKTYPICRWSGDLGPKVREGDRQAPEGFYAISPAQMNPQSAYYLSFNTGYPNAYDRSLGHTGSELMVHGDCSSRGCYAMTDEQIAEIYSLGRESFFGGQKSFQFQAYPFRMTPLNMAKHRNNPNMPFWKMIKEGYDHFEVTRQEPKVDFCEKKYVFDAVKPSDAKRDPVFEASAKCPAYVIPDEVAEAVREKQDADHVETAKLIERGTPVARINTGIDGGMHRVFAAKLPGGNTGLSEGGTGLALLTLDKAPGTIPPGVNPPRGPVTSPEDPWTASVAPATPPASGTRVASATPATQNTQSQNTQQNTQSEGFFSSLARKVGLGGTADTTATAAPPPAPAKPKVAEAKPPRPEASIPKGTAPKADTKQAAARPPLKPGVSDSEAASSAPAFAPAAPSMVAGAQPVLSANSFESRFSAAK